MSSAKAPLPGKKFIPLPKPADGLQPIRLTVGPFIMFSMQISRSLRELEREHGAKSDIYIR